MGDLVLRSLPMFLVPAPTSRFGNLRRRGGGGGGSGVRGLCRKRSVGAGASDLEIVYSTERSDGSVVFRFGTASEIAEYVALKKAECESVAVVEDGTLEENVVIGGEEETVEGFANEVAGTNLSLEYVDEFGVEKHEDEIGVEKHEDEIDCTSSSSEKFIGVGISGDYAEVSDSNDLSLDVRVEEPSVCEDDGSVCMEKVSSVQNSASNEIVVESECADIVTTFEKTDYSNGDFEPALGKENVGVESTSVLDDKPRCNSEEENFTVEHASDSADDCGGIVGKDNTDLDKTNASDENADTKNEFNKILVVESISYDEDLALYDGGESTILEEDNIVDEDLDPKAPEPDVKGRVSIDESSSSVEKEDAWSHSIDGSINSLEGITAPISETIDSGYSTDSVGNVELSTVEETRIISEVSESDYKEVPFVNATLTINEERECNNDKEFVVLQKTSTSEVVDPENTHDAVSVVEQPFGDEISNHTGYSQTCDASGSLISIVPVNLSISKSDFPDKSSNGTITILDTVAVATCSTNEEDTNGSDSVEEIPIASQFEEEIFVDERTNFDSKEGFPSTTGVDSLNLTGEKATLTSEVITVSEADLLRDTATTISVSNATDQIPAQATYREEASSVALCLSMGAALLPKTLEALTGGEDAYFTAGEAWFGVADGEGQWSLEGIDGGLYGHELMECCRQIVSDGVCYPTNTNEVLSRSAAEATLPGSATVLIAYFYGQLLHVSNIGDTGFIIVRNGAILSRSMPTVHDFHFPHQIQKGYDPLEFVEVYEIELNECDIIVAATDGLFDNLYDQEIASIVTKSLRSHMSPEEVAAVLAVKAQEMGGSTSTRSPFADAAQAAGYAGCTGGKLDDVTVIVSVVQKKSA